MYSGTKKRSTQLRFIYFTVLNLAVKVTVFAFTVQFILPLCDSVTALAIDNPIP